MKLHDLRPAPGSHTRRTRVGRGIAAGKGKTAGRGTKGQKARAGGSIPPWFEGGQTPLHMRIPKLRGFTNRFKIHYEVVNVGAIAAAAERGAFESGDLPGAPKGKKAAPLTVNQDVLRAVGLVRSMKKPLKILGAGDLDVALFVVADAFTKSATSQDRGRRRDRQRPRDTGRGDQGARRRRRSSPAARGTHCGRPAGGHTEGRRPGRPRIGVGGAGRGGCDAAAAKATKPSKAKKGSAEPEAAEAAEAAAEATQPPSRRAAAPEGVAPSPRPTPTPTRTPQMPPTSPRPLPATPRRPTNQSQARQTPPTTRTRSKCSSRC